MGRFIGHRGPQDDEWSWEPTSEPPNNGGRRRLPWLIACAAGGAAVVVLGAIFLFFSGDNDGSADGLPSESPATASASPTRHPTATPTTSQSATPTAEPSATATSTPRPTATPVPATPAPATPAPPTTGLWTWSRASQTWLQAPLTAQNSNYREGESVPLMLIVEGASAGVTYTFRLTYDCEAGGAKAVDFLTDGGPDALMAAQTAPGPQSGVPDATGTIPDDPSITADDNAQRAVRVWGGTFQEAPAGPDPQTPCDGSKVVELRIRALLNTVYVVWGAHLAQDATSGASTAGEPINVQARLNRGTSLNAEFAPGSISR